MRISLLSTISNRTRARLPSDIGWTGSAPWILLATLILGDLVLVGLHLLHVHTELLRWSRWSIERDGGFGEVWQYLKFAGICLALVHLFAKTRLPVLLAWAAVFLFLLLDDSIRIHERFGLAVAAWTQTPQFGALRGRDIGELVFALLVFVVIVPILAPAWLRSSPQGRALSSDLAVLLAGFIACSVGGDLLHRLLSDTAMNTAAGILEDGGEMVVLSLTCFCVAQAIIMLPANTAACAGAATRAPPRARSSMW